MTIIMMIMKSMMFMRLMKTLLVMMMKSMMFMFAVAEVEFASSSSS